MFHNIISRNKILLCNIKQYTINNKDYKQDSQEEPAKVNVTQTQLTNQVKLMRYKTHKTTSKIFPWSNLGF